MHNPGSDNDLALFPGCSHRQYFIASSMKYSLLMSPCTLNVMDESAPGYSRVWIFTPGKECESMLTCSPSSRGRFPSSQSLATELHTFTAMAPKPHQFTWNTHCKQVHKPKKKTQHMRTPSIKILTSGVSPITRLHCSGLDSQNLVNKQPQTKINWQWKLLVLFQDHTP